MYYKKNFQLLLDKSRSVILDGGLACEIERQGYALTTPLWSAQLLLDDPMAIVNAHKAYIRAGADVITTASYQASLEGFMSSGLSKEQAGRLILFSVALVSKAIHESLLDDPALNRPLIAASIGPYGAYLADGSEYKGNYGISDTRLREFHAKRLKILDHSATDVLACETIPSYQEAKILGQLLKNVATPAWLSFSCRDGRHINDGTDIKQAARLFADHPKVLAVGVNCTAPQFVSELIEQLTCSVPNKAIIVYPNSGELYQAESKSWQSIANPVNVNELVSTWHRLGANIIGGCCRVGAQQIAGIREAITG